MNFREKCAKHFLHVNKIKLSNSLWCRWWWFKPDRESAPTIRTRSVIFGILEEILPPGGGLTSVHKHLHDGQNWSSSKLRRGPRIKGEAAFPGAQKVINTENYRYRLSLGKRKAKHEITWFPVCQWNQMLMNRKSSQQKGRCPPRSGYLDSIRVLSPWFPEQLTNAVFSFSALKFNYSELSIRPGSRVMSTEGQKTHTRRSMNVKMSRFKIRFYTASTLHYLWYFWAQSAGENTH